ncbi:hypothetical protein COO60DRAFT_1542983 [Scenedesmus sp. NREL 46B-D3]|nr:hypothetical protein COO60DRAFT_1542983 [Scenedesmus sp. NREL 46B-D3]
MWRWAVLGLTMQQRQQQSAVVVLLCCAAELVCKRSRAGGAGTVRSSAGGRGSHSTSCTVSHGSAEAAQRD